jgi:hypothetical protein
MKDFGWPLRQQPVIVGAKKVPSDFGGGGHFSWGGTGERKDEAKAITENSALFFSHSFSVQTMERC